MLRPQYYPHPPQYNIPRAPNFRPRGRFQDNKTPYRPEHPSFGRQQHSNEEHWCETCDRGFPTVAKLEEHKQQHQKCNIDGCQFTAHPNLVTKHIQMQHASGLFKKIGNLNNPEEINKWREERKNKYPTKQNVDKKTAMMKEKVERGEKMGLKHERFPHNRNNEQFGAPGGKRNYPFGRENQTTRRFERNNSMKRMRQKFPVQKPEKEVPVSENRGKLKPFAGIQQIVDADDEEDVGDSFDDLIEDDFDNYAPKETTLQPENTSKPICGALSNLICNYGSSDEEADLTIDKTRNKTATQHPKTADTSDQNPLNQYAPAVQNVNKMELTMEANVTNKAVMAEDDDSGPEEVKVIKPVKSDSSKTMDPESNLKLEEISKKPAFDRNARRKDKAVLQRKRHFQKAQRKPKIPSTLIYKLLHKEIKQERNIVLQCVRHIVKNNFFDQ